MKPNSKVASSLCDDYSYPRLETRAMGAWDPSANDCVSFRHHGTFPQASRHIVVFGNTLLSLVKWVGDRAAQYLRQGTDRYSSDDYAVGLAMANCTKQVACLDDNKHEQSRQYG